MIFRILNAIVAILIAVIVIVDLITGYYGWAAIDCLLVALNVFFAFDGTRK